MSNIETKEFKFRADTKQAEDDLKQLDVTLNEVISLAYGLTSILSRLGLNEDVTRALRQLQSLISTLNMLRTSMLALYAASGPVGWALAGIGVIGAGVSMAGTVENMLDSQVRR